MVTPGRWYALKGRLVALLTALHIINSAALAEGVRCDWYNDESANLKWIPSYSAELEEELVTETCDIKVNCKSEAVLITDLPGKELTFEYFIKGDHRSKLYLRTPQEELLEVWANYVTPQEDWKEVSIKIPKNAGTVSISGHIASRWNKIYLRRVGIQGVSRSCKSEPIRRTTTTSSTTTTTTAAISTTGDMSASASTTRWTKPRPTATTTVATEKISVSGIGRPGNGGQNSVENEVEEKLELQKVEVVPILAAGFTEVVTPKLCAGD